MAQKPADVARDFDVAHVKPNDAVGRMAERAFEEVSVLREERGALQMMQQRNQVGVLNTGARKFLADLPEGECATAARTSADRRGRFRPANSCGQLAGQLPMKPSAGVKECAARKANGFEHGGFANAPAPSRDDPVNGFAACEVFKNLPDHDARALVSRLAVADQRIGHDIFAKLNPLSIAPAGIGLFDVRFITASISASYHMFSAPDAPAPSAIQNSATNPSQG